MTPDSRLTGLPRDRLLCEFSLWSADLVRLADDIARVDDHVDIWHVDVADGHFAPALLFFPDQVARVRELTRRPIHVHLMVADAILDAQIRQFAEAGADLVSVHAENAAVLPAALDRLDELGVAAGLVLKWDTPVAAASPQLARLAMLTLLGTAIGVKGQSLSPAAPGRLTEARAAIAATGRDVILAADGGIREATVPLLRAAGADTVVMGSLAFGAEDLAARIGWARALPGPAGSEAGRAAMRTALAIDIGGTELRLALVGEDGAVRARRRTATDAAGGPDAVLAQIVDLADDLDLAGADPVGIGVGCPGPLDAVAGTVTGPPTLAGWDGYPLAARLGKRFGLPATLGNDGHAAALGEWRFGAGRGLSDFIYITVSTGIGGGIVSGGRLVTGRGGLGGHIGHMRVTDAPVRCSCGITGCLEAVASGSALGRAARAAAAADPAGAIARLAGDAPADARHAGRAARDGDPAALAAIETVARHLGTGIASLVHLLAPERVVIGGGLAALLDLMQPTIEAVLEARTMPAFRPVEVVAAGLDRDAGLVGAALLALEPPGAEALSTTTPALRNPEPQQRTSP